MNLLGVTYILAGTLIESFSSANQNSVGPTGFYEIIPGKLKILNVSLRIQEYDLPNRCWRKRDSRLLKRKKEKFIEASMKRQVSLRKI